MIRTPLFHFAADRWMADFPSPEEALAEPAGLLAAGGDLSPGRLLAAYRQGIFPWYSCGEPILWWSPDPRCVLFPGQLHLSRRLRRTLDSGRFRLSVDTAFDRVIAGCAAPRAGQEGTWITPEMIRAYTALHRAGHAHSIEVWQGNELAGGLYGVAIGQAFFAESMFHRVRDASKVALAGLCERLLQWGYGLIDCQVESAHLRRMGARTIPRAEFLSRLERLCTTPAHHGAWTSRGDHPAPDAGDAPGPEIAPDRSGY